MPYREEFDALEHRQARLAEDLERIDEALAHARSLDEERAQVSRELADVRALLGAPLDGVRAASPCSAAWELMEGDGCARRCQACGKRVYNVSGLSRPDAARLLGGRTTKLRRREDGTLIAGDCPLGSRLRRRGRTVVGAGTAALIGAGLIASALAPDAPVAPEPIDPNAVDGASSVYVPVELENEIEVGLEGRSEERARPEGESARETR